MADTREILLKLIGRETVSGAAKKAARGVEDLGDELDEAARDAKQLDRALDDTHRSITGVLAALAKDPGDIGLRKQLRALDRESKNLKKIRADFLKLGDDAGSGFAARFVGRLGPILASAPISPALIGAAAAASPGIAAVLSGGVLAGLSGGVVAAGVAAAAQDQRVKTEASRLGDILAETMKESTASFVPATIGALHTVRDEVSKLGPVLKRVGQQGAAFVAPLTRGVTNLVKNALPGIESALRKSGPVIYQLERGLGQVGTAAGKALDAIADGASGAGLAIGDLLKGAAIGLVGIGKGISTLTKLYQAMRVATAVDKTAVLAEIAAGEAASAGYEAELRNLIDGLGQYGSGAAQAAADTRTLAEQQRDAAQAAQSQYGAITSLEGAIDDARAAMKENGKTHDENTAKGRANRDALQELAGAATAAYEQTVALSGSTGKATEVMDRSYKAFVKTAEGMGYSKDEAHALAVQLGLIPPKTKTKHEDNSPAAQKRAEALKRKLEAIEGEYRSVIVIETRRIFGKPSSSASGAGIGGSDFKGRAAGGPVRAGETYWVGEKGPELLTMPRNGHVTPNHKLPEVAPPVNINITVNAGGTASPHRIAREVARQVQDVTASRAALLERTG